MDTTGVVRQSTRTARESWGGLKLRQPLLCRYHQVIGGFDPTIVCSRDGRMALTAW